ncbi:MAG TPA: hypothetical protein VFP89_01135 [Propionibacteriaceae bacterium]|nr:hypothetical protein [Propionibacteriaceae bacterium]
MSYTLQLRQRFTVMQNRYDVARIDGAGETPLAFAQQKRLSLREKISFYTDESARTVAFTLQARNIIELVGIYDIVEPNGQVLATLRKDAVASLFRSTYHVETPLGTLTGRERTRWRPIARRVVSMVSDWPWLLPLQFDFVDQQERTLFAVDRQFKVRDVYRIEVHEDGLDWRIAAACAVAVDALMDR